MPSSNSFKRHSSFPEVMNFLDRAQNAMLGFSPDWNDRLLASVASSDSTYPPYDLIKVNPQHYRIVIATAGFTKDEIDVMVEKNKLTISGSKVEETELKTPEEREKSFSFIHRGIATRKFTRSFLLADNTRVENASYENGLLSLDVILEIPPEFEPKKIPIL